MSLWVRQRLAIVRHRFVGFHAWPNAGESEEYLAARHRHVFFVELAVNQRHDDRDVEYHDLLAQLVQWCAAMAPSGDLGHMSCEMIANRLGRAAEKAGLSPEYVRVFEDDENGAELRFA